MNNIDKFNAYTGRTLARLYEAFPQPALLDAVEITTGKPLVGSGPQGAISVNDLQGATRDADVMFCAHTFRWLYDTGYFSGQMSQFDVRVTNAVLTPKSFEALAAMPSALSKQQTTGQQLAEFAKETAVDAVRNGVGQVVGQVIGATMRGFFGPSSG